jgi:hypothetical protein
MPYEGSGCDTGVCVAWSGLRGAPPRRCPTAKEASANGRSDDGPGGGAAAIGRRRGGRAGGWLRLHGAQPADAVVQRRRHRPRRARPADRVPRRHHAPPPAHPRRGVLPLQRGAELHRRRLPAHQPVPVSLGPQRRHGDRRRGHVLHRPLGALARALQQHRPHVSPGHRRGVHRPPRRAPRHRRAQPHQPVARASRAATPCRSPSECRGKTWCRSTPCWNTTGTSTTG